MSLAALIPPPYVACPYCGADAFGVSNVLADHLNRRCVQCGRPAFGEPRAVEALPAITKGTLYLDQFAVSNFAVLADPDADPARVARAEVWRPVYERVSALVGVQRLVCPSSGFHTDEALPQLTNASFMQSLDRLQMRLSGGLSFSDALTIELNQLRHAAEGSIASRALDDPHLIASSPFRGGSPHGWLPRLQVGVTTASLYAGVVEDVAASMSAQGSALRRAFASWRELPPASVRNQFDLELSSYGPSLLRAYASAVERAFSDPMAYASSAAVRYRAVLRFFGDDDERAAGWLQSADVTAMPKLRISAAMYAVLARQAANGMREVEPSFAVDVEITSTVLPYVDAILVDGRCAEVLRQPPAIAEVARWGTVVLSARDLDSTVRWLDALAADVTEAHLATVARVYGPSTVEQFRRVFPRD